MVQAGTGGQTNVTQSDSTGNQNLDISPINRIDSDMSLDDIAGAYTDIAHQYEGIASKAAADVGRRQTELIGNDFGAVNPYNYNQYYEPGSNSFQSTMRVEGTQRALEEGMERAKKEAENNAAAAQNNYNNAQSALTNLENAKNNFELVNAGLVGGNTSAEEFLKFVESSNANNAEELNRDASAKFLSDSLVNGAWDLKDIRESAKADTLNKFGISREQYDNFSQEEHDNFWARGDVGDYWTNRYAYQYAEQTYGKAVADEYQEAYEYNYNIIKNVFDEIKSGASSLKDCFAAIKTVKMTFDTGDKMTISGNYLDDVKIWTDGMEFTSKGKPTTRNEDGTINIGENEANSIYNFITPEAGQELQKILDSYFISVHDERQNPLHKLTDEQKETIENFTKVAIQSALLENDEYKQLYARTRSKAEFVNDYNNLDNFIETAFGADIESVNYLMDMSTNNPQQYEDLMHDYSLVATYGTVFEIADGEKVYHTASGDKVLDAGTYVMYTLPGFQDANGNILEPNLKRYMELRKEEFSADMDEEKLEEEMTKCLEGYQKVAIASLFLAAGADCDTNESIVHSVIYASNPTSDDTTSGVIYGGHTVKECIEKFAELADKDGEKAYTLFTKIIKKASSVSGSMMANYGGQLVTMNTKDAVGRDMVGSEITGSKDANTLFSDGDIDKLTVEEATALWTVIGTSIDRYNNGHQTGNIKSDFLTADGLNWFNETGIEFVRGIVGIVDLVGNTAWSFGRTVEKMFTKGLTGQKLTEQDFNDIFKSKRWGTGGITGNWTGATSIYDQFVDDYDPNAFGYGESNQSRMTDNLNHLVNPLIEDMWFGEDYSGTQNAMGVGRASDEGFNYRSAMHFTSSMAGLVLSVVAGNMVAKGVGTVAKWGAKLAHSIANGAALGVKGKFASAFLRKGAQTAEKLLNGASKVAGVTASSSADDIARVVASDYTDDVAKAAANYVDDVTGAVAEGADDITKVAAADAAKEAAKGALKQDADDIMNMANRTGLSSQWGSLDAYDDYARNQAQAVQALMEADRDSVYALGAAATSITSSSLDDVADKLVKYSEKVFRQLASSQGVADNVIDDVVRYYGQDVVDKIVRYEGKLITKEAFTTAHIASYTGMSVDDIANLSTETKTLLSNFAHVQMGGTVSGMPNSLVDYLAKQSKANLTELAKELSERATIRASAGGVWSMDDTIRTLARNGWDSKRLSLLTKQWFKDQVQDMATDVLYGYIKPTVTNEGTDRETVDEYFTNPMNYIMNLGASGIQFFGGRILNNLRLSTTTNSLDRARKALQIADAAGDTARVERKSRKVLKLVDKANSLADKALERGKTLADIRELTDKCAAYADDAVWQLEKGLIRNMDINSFDDLITNFTDLNKNITSEDVGLLKSLFIRYNAGVVNANARYFDFKKMLGTYDNGLGNVVDMPTNGKIWTTLFEGRTNILKEMDIPRGTVTIDQQKKIYKAMIDHVMDQPFAKTIPGLRNSLTNYFDVLTNLAKEGGFENMRAGYLPIESMLNTNKDISAGIRGFSNGSWVLDAASANPFLERSEALKDTEIVKAILNGEREITLKDADGNPIVDADGVVQTRQLNPDGLNFLDSITNAYNANIYHKYMDPVLGANDERSGLASLVNQYVVVKQDGAMKVSLDKSIKYDKTVMQNIENDILQTKAEKAANTRAKNAATAKADLVIDENPDVKNAATAQIVGEQLAGSKASQLEARKTELTNNQRQFPAALMNYVDENGKIDTRAGFIAYNTYKEIVKQDLKKFANGEIDVGGVIVDKYRRLDRFSWQYGRDKWFGKTVDGYTQSVPVTSEYYALLQNCVTNGISEPPKDMVMKRLIMGQTTAPLDADGNVFKSVATKSGKTYEWSSPLQYFRSSLVSDDAMSNIELRSFQRRGSLGNADAIGGWKYRTSDKGKWWTMEQFSKLTLDSPENVAIAKDIVTKNLNLPKDKNGNLLKTAKNMLDVTTNEILTAAKGSSKSGAISVTFSDYIDELSYRLADNTTFSGAFDETSGYGGIFTDLNRYRANGGIGYDEFNDYLTTKLRTAVKNGENIDDLVSAWAVWHELEAHDHRAIGLGNNFDAGVTNDDGYGVLFNSSEEAIEANSAQTDLNPEKFARKNEIAEKGAKAANATTEETNSYFGDTYTARYGDKMSAELDLLSSVTASPEDLKKGLKGFKKVFGEFLDGDMNQQRVANRKEILQELNGKSGEKGLIGQTNSIIKEAAEISPAVKSRINTYTGQRRYRQKAYGFPDSGEYDAMKAFGATYDGYTVVDSPAQFRAAATNVSLYESNRAILEPLQKDFADATESYLNMLSNKKHYTEKELLKAQGLVDETRKVLANKMEDVGIDLTNGYATVSDRSGYVYSYDKMMLEGGTIEGRVNQSIFALQEVRDILSDNPFNDKNVALINKIDTNISKLEAIKNKIPDYEKVSMVQKIASSPNDSFELSMAGLMSDALYGDMFEQSTSYVTRPDGTKIMTTTKPNNGWFTDDMLNSIAAYEHSSDLTGSGKHRLGYSLDENGNPVYTRQIGADRGKTTFDFNKYKNATLEMYADLDDETFDFMVQDSDKNVIDPAKFTPEEAAQFNEAAFESQNTLYRFIPLEEADPGIVESVGAVHGDYVFVKLRENEFSNDVEASSAYTPRTLDEAADAAYTEWLAFSKDEDSLQAAIDRELKKVNKAGKKVAKETKKTLDSEVADPDDASKTVKYTDLQEEEIEGIIKDRGTEKQYKDWKAAKDHLDYSRRTLSKLENGEKVDLYRDHNGAVYLDTDSPNIAGYSTYLNQLEARGYKPVKKGENVPDVDPKLDKKTRKQMNKAITKNRHAGDVFNSRLEDFDLPRDKDGNILLDAKSKASTILNMENLYQQVRDVTGLDLNREGILMSNEFAELLTRIAGESTEASKIRKFIGATSNFSQAIQNGQLAGGASFVNAYSIAQMRDAILRTHNPRVMLEYAKVVGSMRNSRAVSNFALNSLPLLSQFVLEIGDDSILNDFGAAISTRPGVQDGGVLQNMWSNTLNFRKDWIDARVKNDGSIPKAFRDIVAKDIQNTIFEDSTFMNAMPVLRAKMLIENYDAAASKLAKKFPDADPKIINKAAIQISYGQTMSFLDPYHTMGGKTLTEVLDNTFSKKMRDFAATYVNAKSQTTVLDTLTNFFFALRYKMMLSGRVYDGAISAIPRAKAALSGRAINELTEETFDDAMDTIGTAMMHKSANVGLSSLAICAVVAATTAKSMGIPTAWDDVSWIDEYDGSFKIPDVLLKFQTIGQIWLPNAYSNEKGFYVDATKNMYGIDTMSSIFTLQNSIFRTIDRSINPETYYAAPQRGIIGSESSNDAINQFLNAPIPRAIGDELIGSNLLSPYKAMYEVIMDSTYFGNNIWEKKKLPDGKDNPNYDPGRNIAAMTMHLLGLDQVLDGGKGYNDWVKGVDKATYVEQDQIGTVKGSGVIQHEFLTAALDLLDGKYIESIYGAGELPIKAQNLSSKARTEFNTRVKNIVAGYNDEYKAVATSVDSTNADKDAAYKDYVKKSADAVATWSKKYNYALGQDQELVPYVTRTLMAMLSGEYDDNMYYVQDAYWKASDIAQIEGVTANNYWLDDEDLKEWIAQGKSAEEFAEEKNKRTRAYNQAQDEEYEARKALLEANRDADGNELIKGLESYLTDRYSYSDLKAEQRAVNKEIFTSIHSKLDSKVGEFDNYKEMKTYYEKLIDGATSKSQKVNLAMKYNTYVFDLVAPYAEKYGANIVNDGYFNGKGLANDLSDYVILPADQNYQGKSPITNYIKDVFNVGYRKGDALPSDKEVYERFITAQNLAMKGAVSSSIAVLDNILEAMRKGRMFVSDADYSKIINMRAILSARSK